MERLDRVLGPVAFVGDTVRDPLHVLLRFVGKTLFDPFGQLIGV